MLKVSQRGLQEIAAHEGIVSSAYKDSVGVWTVGIGHTKNAGYPNPAKERREFSLDEIMGIFARDIEKFENRVRKAFTRKLTQEQFDAAVSFDFNTGGIHRASWVRQFNAGNIVLAKKKFMDWRKPSEIIPRRKKERDLFFDGKYSGNGYVNVYPASGSGTVLWSKGKRMAFSAFDKEHNLIAVPNVSAVSRPRLKTLLKKGSRGQNVKTLQNMLDQYSYIIGQIDGIFGAKTESAVKSFQERNGLTVDGKVRVGGETWTALKTSIDRAQNTAMPPVSKISAPESFLSKDNTPKSCQKTKTALTKQI